MEVNYDYLKKNNLILLEVVVGSQAYGTSLPTSDRDVKFVYSLPKEFILGTKYAEQINVNKDFTGYEIRRFLELLAVGNPTVLELIAKDYPKDCIIYKSPIFDLVLNHRDVFVTKRCKDSFLGYAVQQIRKSRGLNKKQNLEAKKITRKTPLDFCYAIIGEKSISLKEYLRAESLDQKFCGLVNVNHVKDLFSLFYDIDAAKCFSELYDEISRNKFLEFKKTQKSEFGFGYKGIEVDNSNSIRLSSIPKGQTPLFNIVFLKDSYQMHCKHFKEYQEWIKNRNITRYTDFNSHGQGLDGKNLMHCKRLIDMAKEIANGDGIIIQRKNAIDLLKIRKGEIALKELITNAEQNLLEIDALFKKSNLPDSVDGEFVHNLLVQIRTEIYQIQ